MTLRQSTFVLTVIFIVAGPEWCFPRAARAGITIKELVEDPNKQGVLVVGPFTFTFDENSVQGDRTAAQVTVDAVDKNGVAFTIDPAFSVTSNMLAAQTLSLFIQYTVEADVNIISAALRAGTLADNTANGASALVKETLRNNDVLSLGKPPPANAIQSVLFNNPQMSLFVVNAATISVPLRGQGGDADNALIGNIVNTFEVAPEPGSLIIMGGLGLIGLCGRRRLSS